MHEYKFKKKMGKFKININFDNVYKFIAIVSKKNETEYFKYRFT